MGYVLNGIMGAVIGDAVGVPVEFYIRDDLKKNPVTDMTGYGTHQQPMGTWSDDSSMILATMDSLLHGLNVKDIMNKFSNWCLYGDYTPYGKLFDIGITTRTAILNYGHGINPVECGCTGEKDNGNGSLMRILPAALYRYVHSTPMNDQDKWIQMIHNISALTHAHPRSKIACGIYSELVIAILNFKLSPKGSNIIDALQQAMETIFSYYSHLFKEKYNDRQELKYYKRIQNLKVLIELNEEKIKSSGYVVHTLEAALWCFLTTNTYKECILKAVNLGDDTDTTACVAGGLAGLFYGYESIPENWRKNIARKEWIIELCTNYEQFLNSQMRFV